MGHFKAEGLACLRGGRPVFADLSFELPPGEILLLVGPNGSGKSSLLRVLAGLLRPALGQLTWDGEPVQRDLVAHFERLHYVGHQTSLKPRLTVRENLAFWGELRGGAKEGAVETALERLALERLAPQPAEVLSSGQRRRLALARLLVASTPLWLLDEPTVGLDDANIARLRSVIEEHRAGGGAAVIATHLDLGLNHEQTLSLGDFAPSAEMAEAIW